MELDENYDSSKKNSKGDIIQAIGKCIKVLKSKRAPKKDRKFYLKLLIHFIGDLHQPLHLGKKSDKGGNDVKIKWFGEISNLHRLWDSDMINDHGMSYSELAKNLTGRHNEPVVIGNVSDWADESHKEASKIYSQIERGINLGYLYNHNNFPLVKDKLYKAGFRLAVILNEIFSI